MKSLSVTIEMKAIEKHVPVMLCIIGVGQGFWVYSIQGSSKSDIRYIYAEIWVLSISFVLLTANFGYNVL